MGNVHENSHYHVPGGLNWLLIFLPTKSPCWPCVSPTDQMLAASQSELKAMMNGETGKLLKLRSELETEMERIS